MKKPAVPETESDRQASLDRLEILDTPAEERFDRITRLACRLFGVPIALVSLVDRDRQWFKSAQGISASETPREISFCGHAILGDEATVVPDASKDERFADNPLVTGDPGIRFYAGQPLTAPDGQKVGTLCLIDRRPRELANEDAETLRDLAAFVESELAVAGLSQSQRELRTQLASAELRASVDALTRLWNRESILEILRREVARAERGHLPMAVILADLDDFKLINDRHGHLAGDAVLRVASERIRGALRPYDAVGRYGGEEFLIVLIECDRQTSAAVTDRVCRRVAGEPTETPQGDLAVTISLGVAEYDGKSHIDVESLVATADTALYRAKALGKNRVEYERLVDTASSRGSGS